MLAYAVFWLAPAGELDHPMFGPIRRGSAALMGSHNSAQS
jgi:hypothetical protein